METRPYDRIAAEVAALRRVAALVARGALPEEVFAAVAAEAGLLLGAELTTVARYDPGGVVVILGTWSSAGTAKLDSAGTRASLAGRNMSALVFQTGRAVRIDDYRQATGEAADLGRELGFQMGVGVPITVDGRLWGIMTVASTGDEPLPADTKARLVAFTELAGAAIANAEAQAALAASRARIVTAADEARRRIERDLHDGAQQHLVTLALQVRELQDAVPSGAGELTWRLARVTAGLEAALEELREIARGIHPAALTQGGRRPALRGLVRRCPVPVDLYIQVADRPPQSVEIAACYVVCEALANTAKHAAASAAEVEVVAGDGILRVCVRDDGRGGAQLMLAEGVLAACRRPAGGRLRAARLL